MGNVATQAMEVTRAELHLRTYPYFCITPADPNTWSMVYEEELRLSDEVSAKRTWTIKAHPEHGWPGEIEADVWRALEHWIVEQIDEQGGPVENPILFTLHDIRRRMPGKGFGKSDLDRIKEALDCLRITVIIANCFYKAAIQEVDELNTAIISRLRYVMKKLADGREILDHVEAWIDPDILNNINLRYTRPLDKGYLDSMDRWIAKRLYELLGPKFYGLRKTNLPYRIRYSRLCALLGNKRQQYLCNAKRILGRSHDDLRRTGFLVKIEWFPVKNDRHDWTLTYWPGSRGRSEARKEFWQVKDVPRAIVIEGDFNEDQLAPPIAIEGEADTTAAFRKETDLERFMADAREAFVELTGTRRPWDREDCELTEELFRAGVSVEDVERGIEQCLADREERAFEDRKMPWGTRERRQVRPVEAEPIRTLRYCVDQVWRAFEER